MRFLHTADWHLGRLFHNVHLTEDQAHVLAQFLEVVRDVRPDAVVIAGDIYDRTVPPAEAVELLDEVLTKLTLEAKVPTIVIAGNHDGPERLSFGAKVLADRGLHLVGTFPQARAIPVTTDGGTVEFLTLPYAVPEEVRQWCQAPLAKTHDSAMRVMIERSAALRDKSRRCVLVAHAFVVGGQESDSERKLAIGKDTTVSAEAFDEFDYVALGHLHEPQWIRREAVRYSGSLLKYSFAEASHTKSVSLVEMDEQGRVQVRPIELSPRHELRIITGSLDQVLASAAKDPSPRDYITVRLMDPEPLLNPMAKLRQHYPNVLHIDRPMFGPNAQTEERIDHRRVTAMELFDGFYRQTTGETLSEAQRKTVAEVVEGIQGRSGGEAA